MVFEIKTIRKNYLSWNTPTFFSTEKFEFKTGNIAAIHVTFLKTLVIEVRECIIGDHHRIITDTCFFGSAVVLGIKKNYFHGL